MDRPVNRQRVLLDLFAGAGGAAEGYHRAGFRVLGVDHKYQRNYPFPFVRADAMDVLAGNHWHLPLRSFDAIHASPPCQHYLSEAKQFGTWDRHPDLVDEVRRLLKQNAGNVPYVIENVAGAPLWHPIMLCGEMFDLGVFRHRYFELGWRHNLNPFHPHHRGEVGDGTYFTITGHTGRGANLEQWKKAIGIDWMTSRELAQAIPPVYTQWIGERLLGHLEEIGA